MRALALATVLAASAVAGSAAADVFMFSTNLNGATEEPQVVTAGIGYSKLFLDTDLHTMRVVMTFQDLIGNTTAAHVHAPTAFANAGNVGVATELPSFTGFPLGVTSGAYDHTFDTSLIATWNPGFVAANGGTAAGAESAFLAALQAERAYVNIHTTFSPRGEIRGFYKAAVPEPATWALMIVGFGLAGGALRRRVATRPATLTT